MKRSKEAGDLKVIARSPFHIYYEGDAEIVSASNKIGPFDILPGHADFFSILEAGDIKIETKNDTIKFDTSNGIISVRDNEVLLFVNM